MNADARKSLIRQLRQRVVRYMPIVDETYALGRSTAQLIPDWLESEYQSFDDFLHRGCNMEWSISIKLSDMALSYFEIPSVEIWRQIGYSEVLRAASKSREACLDRLADLGVNPLDILGMPD